MRIGNLSQTPFRSRGTVAYQLLRVLIVTSLAAAGGFALSLSAEDRSAVQEIVTAVDRNNTVIALGSSSHPEQTASVQIASATPEAETSNVMPESASEVAVQENAEVRAPGESRTDQAAVLPASVTNAASTSVTEHAATAQPSQPEMTGTVKVAGIATDPTPESDLVDLNTASFEQLNRLRSAGSLGRAIIKGRPYASVDDLVKRKVVRRSVYERIKDQVTVR